MMLYPDAGELVLEDSPNVIKFGGRRQDGAIAVVDIETGEEKARALMNEQGTTGMFLCPGFERDFYVCTIESTIANDRKKSKL